MPANAPACARCGNGEFYSHNLGYLACKRCHLQLAVRGIPAQQQHGNSYQDVRQQLLNMVAFLDARQASLQLHPQQSISTHQAVSQQCNISTMPNRPPGCDSLEEVARGGQQHQISGRNAYRLDRNVGRGQNEKPHQNRSLSPKPERDRDGSFENHGDGISRENRNDNTLDNANGQGNSKKRKKSRTESKKTEKAKKPKLDPATKVKCEYCNKSFLDQEGLSSHMRAKHDNILQPVTPNAQPTGLLVAATSSGAQRARRKLKHRNPTSHSTVSNSNTIANSGVSDYANHSDRSMSISSPSIPHPSLNRVSLNINDSGDDSHADKIMGASPQPRPHSDTDDISLHASNPDKIMSIDPLLDADNISIHASNPGKGTSIDSPPHAATPGPALAIRLRPSGSDSNLSTTKSRILQKHHILPNTDPRIINQMKILKQKRLDIQIREIKIRGMIECLNIPDKPGATLADYDTNPEDFPPW